MRPIKSRVALFMLVLLFCAQGPAWADSPSEENKPADSKAGSLAKAKAGVEPADLGETRNVHRCQAIYLAGQPTPEDIAKIKAAGVAKVITLRTEGEVNWDEGEEFGAAGIDFISLPFREPQDLTDSVFGDAREVLNAADDDAKVLLHCGSANRVGAIWLAHRVLDRDIPLEQAEEEAVKVGLRTKAYKEKSLDYISRQRDQQETP